MRACDLADHLAPFGFLDEEAVYRRSGGEAVLFRQFPARGPGAGRFLITYDAPRAEAPFSLLVLAGADEALPLSILRQEFARGEAIQLCRAHDDAVIEVLARTSYRALDDAWRITPGRLAHRLGEWEALAKISAATARRAAAGQRREGRLADLLSMG